MGFFSFFLGSFTVGSYKTFGEINNLPESYLTIIGSVGSIFNAIRFIWSGLLDRYSYKVVYGTLLVLQIIFGTLIIFCKKSEGLYAICYCMIMFCEGGHFTIVPNVLKQIFGDKATQLYSFAFSYTGAMSLILLFT